MCSLLVPYGSRTHTQVRRGFKGGDLIYRSILLVPRGGVLALRNQVHEEVQEGAPALPSVLQLLLAQGTLLTTETVGGSG